MLAPQVAKFTAAMFALALGLLASTPVWAAATTYTYDALGRLVTVITPYGKTTYVYDAAGNRVGVTTTRSSYKFILVPVGGGKLLYLR